MAQDPSDQAPGGKSLRSMVRRVVDPDVDDHRRLIRDVAKAMPRLQKTLGSAVEQIKEQRATVSKLERDVAWLRAVAVRQRKVSSQLLRRADLDERTAVVEQRLHERLSRLSRSSLPIIVGPWTGEVGFEVLYWIPFLQWICNSFPIDRERLIVLSRGGTAPWYGHLADRYVDAFTHVTPDVFRDETDAVKKQRGGRRFDRRLLRAALREQGITRAHLLHPMLMYDLFWSFWAYNSTVRDLDRFTAFRPLERIPMPDTLADLPKDYVAVRFYFSRCFPDVPENRAFVQRTLASLTAQTDVVLLNTTFTVDDHHDFSMSGGRVHSIADRMEPATNLALQTAVIANARAFVGTYGGYSYLAPFYGVSSVAFYSNTTFKRQHLDLAHRVFTRLGRARLVPVDVSAADALWLAFADHS